VFSRVAVVTDATEILTEPEILLASSLEARVTVFGGKVVGERVGRGCGGGGGVNGRLSKTSREILVEFRSTVPNFHRYVFDVLPTRPAQRNSVGKPNEI